MQGISESTHTVELMRTTLVMNVPLSLNVSDQHGLHYSLPCFKRAEKAEEAFRNERTVSVKTYMVEAPHSRLGSVRQDMGNHGGGIYEYPARQCRATKCIIHFPC